MTGYFANPYNFVPFSTEMRKLNATPPPFGEGRATGADRSHPGRFSAKLTVRFRTVTPLLAMELVSKDPNSSAVYSVRRDANHRPLLRGASVKGLIRSLYEQVTGSRLGVFNHPNPLSVRAAAESAVHLTMVKVDRHDAGERLLSFREQPSLVPVVAPHTPVLSVAIPRNDIAGRRFGDSVYVWLQLQEHDEPAREVRRGTRTTTVGPVRFVSWETIASPSLELPAYPTVARAPRSPHKTAVDGEPLLLVQGTLHNTGRTIRGKHHERLFVDRIVGRGPDLTLDADVDRLAPVFVTVPAADYDIVVSTWQGKLEGFATEVPASNRVGGADPVTVPAYVTDRPRWATLPEGLTLYFRTKDGRIQLYPALITREALAESPAALLGEALRPAQHQDQLTAAERLFGWVAGSDGGTDKAIRGRLRVGGVECVTDPSEGPEGPRKRPVDQNAWRLATLNSPKPSHARFYTRTKDGSPLHGRARSEGYQATDRLAGVKVYPHHGGLPEGYWQLPKGGWEAGKDQPHPQGAGRYRNFLAAEGTPRDVSFAIRDWVEPETEFLTTVYVQDVTRAELTALLWVLNVSAPASQPAEQWHLKLGQGKPLGFGSITMWVDWNASEIRTTEERATRYRSLTTAPSPNQSTGWLKSVAGFDAMLQSRAPAKYLALLAAARGTELPVYYPRVGDVGELAPQAETYQWFVENEKRLRHALPLLEPDREAERLPTRPTAPRG